MIKLPKITASQLFILLIISRMFSMFTYKPTDYNLSAAAAALAVFLSVIINLLIFVPALSLLKRYKDRNLSDISSITLKGGGKVFSAFVIIVCLFLSVECVTQFEVFMTSTIYMNASPLFFVIPMLVVCVYICRLGIETMARMSGFVFGGLIFTVIAILIAVSPQINIVWVQRASSDEGWAFFRFLLENVCLTTEIIPFMILADNTKGKLKNGVVGFCIVIGVLFQLISFLTFAVLGNYKETVMFPFYTVAAMVEKTLTERFNSAYTALWVFMAVIRLCVYLLASAKEIRKFYMFKNNTIPLILSALAVLSATFFTTQKITYLSAMYYFLITGIPLILLAIVFPIIMLVTEKIRERREKADV